MSMTKHTGDPVIDSVINQLNKKFSKDLVTLGPVIRDVPGVSTGSLGLDLALGIGGVPEGRIIEIFGPNASSKTSLCLVIAANAQRKHPGKKALIVDVEYTMTESFIAGFGLDMDNILFSQPDTAEEALQVTMDLTKTGGLCAVVFDSIDACQREAMLNKDLGAADVGGISKLASRFFREYSKVCPKTNTTAMFINQIKLNPGAGMYANPETTPGGTALGFYASLRMKAWPIKPSKDTPNAYEAAYKITKSKVAPCPMDKIEFEFIYGRGPDPILDTLNAAKTAGILACLATRKNVVSVQTDDEVDSEPMPNDVMLALNGELESEQ